MLGKISMEGIIHEVDLLEPVPQIIHQLMEIMDDPETPLSEIADLIVYDPVITANLLRTANSAYFGLNKKVDSVFDAVITLGLRQVVEIVLMCSVSRDMKAAYKGYGLSDGVLWKQSVSCALVAQSIAEILKPESKHIVFTAALLKDIGVIILNKYAVEHLDQFEALMEDDSLDLIAFEREMIGLDHAFLGGEIALKWHFSKKLAGIIKNHHLSHIKKTVDIETAIVYLADSLCTMAGINSGIFARPYSYYDTLCRKLDITEKKLNSVMSEFLGRKDDIYGLLAIV